MTTPGIEPRTSQKFHQQSDHSYKVLNELEDIMYIQTKDEDNIHLLG